MKLFIIALFISTSVTAQYKAVNVNNVTLRYDTTQIIETPEATNNTRWVLLRLKSSNDTLAIIFYDGTIWTKADVTTNDIITIGTSTMVLITLPSAISSTNRYLLKGRIVYYYTASSHYIPDLLSAGNLKHVIRKEDGKNVATYFSDGFIWDVMPASPTLITQGIIKVLFP